MTTVTLQHAKTHFAQLLQQVEAGEEIVVERAGTPVVHLVPLAPPASGPRVGGQDRGLVTVAADFDDPLPADVQADFES